jgi:hypothetical protein
VCGVLGLQRASVDEGITCQPAIGEYQNTTDVTAMYDATGFHLNGIQPGTGTSGCFCFTLSSLDGVRGDLCLSINAHAGYDTFFGTAYSQFRRSRKEVSLPLCSEFNNNTTPTPSVSLVPTVITTSGTTITGFYAVTSTARPQDPQTGSTMNVAGLAGAVVGGVLGIGLLATIVYFIRSWNKRAMGSMSSSHLTGNQLQ